MDKSVKLIAPSEETEFQAMKTTLNVERNLKEMIE